MRLFAIVSDINKNGHAGSKRIILREYLESQYSYEIVQKFLTFFDEQVTYYHPVKEPSPEQDSYYQRITSETRIIELCRQINEELEHEQKIIVLMYLLDFIQSGNDHTHQELDLVTVAAEQMKIPGEEFQEMKAFSFNQIDKVVHQDWLLFINSAEEPPLAANKHIPVEKMDGQVIVLHIPSSDSFIFRYYGNLALQINGHRINPNRSYIWPSGSVLKNPKIGSVYFSWVVGRFIQARMENKFVFTAEDIEYNYRNSRNGVKRFNLNEESGRLIGIIGGSGSGKSTLLNVLNGNLKPRRGTIKINGWDIHKHKDKLKGIIGYVPQDDLLIKELTVYQNLYYNAKLCFSDYSEERIKEVVEKALVDFDLVEARDLNVGDAFTTILSGGQRKRLNIALELIREPSILFIDEPTSGLSSADSEKIITLLKRQTFKGKLIIANIHQPSSDAFKMIDKLLVMDQGGRIIYYGHPISALSYFKHQAHYADADESECLVCGNIDSDEILRIVEARVVDPNGRLTRKRKTTPDEWYQKYADTIDKRIKKIERAHDSSVPKNNFKIPGHFKQFLIFLKRDVLSKIHNKQYLSLIALEAPLLAVILAFFSKNFSFKDGVPTYIFGNNVNLPAFLLMSVIVALFLGLIISAEEIFKDRKILKREKFLNLSRSSYLFSKISILLAISAVQTLLFVLISNYMLDIKGMTFRYWLIFFSASAWANMIGLNISSGLNSVVTIYILVPLILVPQLLFSGVVVEFQNMHQNIASEKKVPLIGDAMTSRWGYEAVAVTQFKDNKFERLFYDAEAKIKNASYYRSYVIPQLFNMIYELKDSSKNGKNNPKLAYNLPVIKKEIEKISEDQNLSLPSFADSLTIDKFNDQTYVSLNTFLFNAEAVYKSRYIKWVDARDKIYYDQIHKLGNNEEFLKFKQLYYNKQLASVVTSENDVQNFNIHDGEIIPTKDAIYRKPAEKSWRAHFYAPIKYFFGLEIDTFWFNIVFIWIYSGVLLLFLYYDVLRKISAYFDTLRLNRINRRRLVRLLNIADQSAPTPPKK